MSPLSIITRVVALAVLASGVSVVEVAGQNRSEPRSAAVEAAGQRAGAESMDAERTRQAFEEILHKHPPSIGRVLKLDPSLMRNESYLEPYPQVRQFLTEHPEVAVNAPFYLERVRSNWDHYNPSPRERMTEAILAGLAGFTAFIVVLSTLVWLIRTIIDHRRWNRLSRIQADVHTKLMDRFASNDELLNYVQTPSGRRFLESGPSPLQEMAPAMSAPFSRILWSVQLGSVLLVSGMGLLFLSDRAIQEARELFYIAGCLATAIGSGFLVSAGAAYALSRRLGLLDRSVQNHA